MNRISILQEDKHDNRVIKLSFKKMRILLDGIVQFFEEREGKDHAINVEAIIVKPTGLGTDDSRQVEIRIVLLDFTSQTSSSHKADKIEIAFCLYPEDADQIKTEISKAVQKRLEYYCSRFQSRAGIFKQFLNAEEG
jgi:hypothetical protein